jgi:hypothetical protein
MSLLINKTDCFFSSARKYMRAGAMCCFILMPVMLLGCADAFAPGARTASIPSPTLADERPEAVNEKPDSVIYLPLGSDVLVPKTEETNPLPTEEIGPFELRSETLAGALQLILADYEIPMAFETNAAMTKTITVANLHGPLNSVVARVCSLADLYCAFEEGTLVIKDQQTFTVSVPPIGGTNIDVLASLATGLQAITGKTPITDAGTRTIVYEATNRTAKMAEAYFQRIRANTALIVFQVYIWEVALSSGNSTGIDWSRITRFGKFKTGISFPGGVGADFTPISIGLPTEGGVNFGADNVIEFMTTYGAVKTISQPQVTVLSGAQATLRAADTVNYVSSLTRTIDNGDESVSTETDSVDTGFTLTIASAWDNATVYGTLSIKLQEFLEFDSFEAQGTTLKLPKTTERELSTQIRMRPGDSLLIAGLVRERDNLDKSGPGFKAPIIPTSRTAATSNTELVFLLKPKVIVYTAENAQTRAAESDNASPMPVKRNETFPTGSISADALNPGL